MLNNKKKDNHFLSFEESVVATLIPALFLILNGVIVLSLKTLRADAAFYILLPATFSLLLMVFISRYKTIAKESGAKILIVYFLSIAFAFLHFVQYGTSLGSDSASYFTNPIFTFFSSGVFSHSEKPFISYGDLPLAGYWLPYNSEFIFAGIGYLLRLDYIQIVGLMHVFSNFLFGVAIFSILLRFTQIHIAIASFIIFSILFYGSQMDIHSIVSMSVFRGFENKGMIWGYYLWAGANLFLPCYHNQKKPVFLLSSGIIIGTSSFFVSGNAIFLVVPITLLAIGAAARGEFGEVIFQLIGFTLSLFVCALFFKLLQTTDVYNVVTSELTFRSPENYQEQSRIFKSPVWLWGLAAILILLSLGKNTRVSSQLLTFLLTAHVVQSDWFFELFFRVFPQYTINFWRLGVLMTPFIPILFSMLLLFEKYSPRNLIIITGFGAIVMTAMVFGLLDLPRESPYKPNVIKPQLLALGQLCENDSLILADRHYGTMLPVIQPSYRYLVGKEYFLNWQIVNFRQFSPEWERALNVRDASIYLSRNPTSKKFGNDLDGLRKVIALEKPDAIIMRKKRLQPENEHLFSSYHKQIYKGTVVYTKHENCKPIFKNMAKKFE